MASPFEFNDNSFTFPEDISENPQSDEPLNDGAFSEAAPKETSTHLPEAGFPQDAGPCVDDPMDWEVSSPWPNLTSFNNPNTMVTSEAQVELGDISIREPLLYDPIPNFECEQLERMDPFVPSVSSSDLMGLSSVHGGLLPPQTSSLDHSYIHINNNGAGGTLDSFYPNNHWPDTLYINAPGSSSLHTASVESTDIDTSGLIPVPNNFHFSNIATQSLVEGPINSQSGMLSNNIHGDIATKAPFTYKPILVLPPARRGGRRGKLTPKQTKEQRDAKLRGVCVRCRRTRIKCIGGIPCAACLKNSNSRIWKTPCVKAHFLDIIESGSIFPMSSLYQLEILGDEDRLSIVQQIALMRHLHNQQTTLNGRLPLILMEYRLAWILGAMGLVKTYFRDGGSHFRKPNIAQITNAENHLVKMDPAGGLLFFSIRPNDPEKYKWALATCFFCARLEVDHDDGDGGDDISFPDILPNGRTNEILAKATNSLRWFCARYVEICLFHYLQTAANNSRDVTANQKPFIYCLLSVLVASDLGPPGFPASKNEGDDTRVTVAYQNLLDRQNRVRMALWVYASIAIDNLQPWTDFWNSLPSWLNIYSMSNLPSLFHESLQSFEEGLDNFTDASIKRLKNLMRSLSFSFIEQAQELDTNRKTLEQHAQLRDFFRVFMMNSKAYSAGIDGWQRRFTEDTWSPTNEDDRKEVSSRMFGALISITFMEVNVQQTYNFLEMLHQHLRQKLVYEKLNEYLSEGGITEEEFLSTLPSPSSSSFLIAHLDESCFEEELRYTYIYSHYRSGKRWAELVALLGEGVLLAGQELWLSQSPLLELNVPIIVGLGSDEEFHRLTKILSANRTWLRDMCAKLNEIVEATTLQVDQDDINSVGGFMKNIVVEAFGEQCPRDANLNPYVPRPSRTDVAFMFLYEHLPRASTISMGSRFTLEILLESLWLSMRTLAQEEDKYDNQSYLDSAVAGALGDAVGRFLVKYCLTLTEDKAGIQIELNIMEARIWKAMKEFGQMFTQLFFVGQERKRGGDQRLSPEPALPNSARVEQAFKDIFT